MSTCSVCGSTAFSVMRTVQYGHHSKGERFNLVRCQGCGTVRTDPLPEDLGSYYPDTYMNHAQREGVLERISVKMMERGDRLPGALANMARRVAPGSELGGDVPPGAHVLDVGAASGHTVFALRRRGLRAYGIEPSARAVEVADRTEAGVVKEGVLTEEILAEQPFAGIKWDVVRFYHTLEHIPDPLAAVRVAGQHLAPKGRVVVTVPNYASLGRRVFGDAWDGLEIPIHVHHFEPATLKGLIERAGLSVVRLGTVPVAGIFAGSLSAWRRQDQPRRRWAQSLAVQLPLVPVEAIAALAGWGDALVVVAEAR